MGPIAGAIAVIKEPIPIIKPILEVGTCSKIILNIKGKASPVPIPWIIRPPSKIINDGAQASITAPIINSKLAAKKIPLVGKFFFKIADNGTTMAITSKQPVVIH